MKKKKPYCVDKINVKKSKSMENANCDVNFEAMLKMPNFVYVVYLTST